MYVQKTIKRATKKPLVGNQRLSQKEVVYDDLMGSVIKRGNLYHNFIVAQTCEKARANLCNKSELFRLFFR